MQRKSKKYGIKKLNKKEFYDVYAISLIMNNQTLEQELLDIALPIAKKYIKITRYALGTELRHVIGFSTYDLTESKRIYWTRKKLKTQEIIDLFDGRKWTPQYGGTKWKKIAKGLLVLEKMYEQQSLQGIILAIDHLNDLEHNNNLYLGQYTTFDLYEALYDKRDRRYDHDSIVSQCSRELKILTIKATSKLYEYHKGY